MTDTSQIEIKPSEKELKQHAADVRAAEFVTSDRQTVLKAVTQDWFKASIIARRAGLNSFRTSRALQFLCAKDLVEKRAMPPKSKLPAWKGGGTMEVQHEYRLVPTSAPGASPG